MINETGPEMEPTILPVPPRDESSRIIEYIQNDEEGAKTLGKVAVAMTLATGIMGVGRAYCASRGQDLFSGIEAAAGLGELYCTVLFAAQSIQAKLRAVHMRRRLTLLKPASGEISANQI